MDKNGHWFTRSAGQLLPDQRRVSGQIAASSYRRPAAYRCRGEIGNNSYDHNLGSRKDIPGIIFFHSQEERTVVIADRGQGIKATLSKIKKEITDDKTAVITALTETVSGRAPEQRGNGLKFVSNTVKNMNWHFYIQSGGGAAEIQNANVSFFTADDFVNGCFAVIKY